MIIILVSLFNYNSFIVIIIVFKLLLNLKPWYSNTPKHALNFKQVGSLIEIKRIAN